MNYINEKISKWGLGRNRRKEIGIFLKQRLETFVGGALSFKFNGVEG